MSQNQQSQFDKDANNGESAAPDVVSDRYPDASDQSATSDDQASDDQSGAEGEQPLDLTESLVREELKKVIDPELFVNIVDLGLIYKVYFEPAGDDQQAVKIDMTMTSPACPAGPQLIAQSKMVVQQMQGVADVEVRIVMDPPWTPEKMTEDARDQLGIF